MPIAASGGSSGSDQKQLLSELSSIQKSIFDQASNYTKIVLGLGYGGFFAAWSGTKANLRPVELVGSALLVCLSLFAYVLFEIFQANFNSKMTIDLARTLNTPGVQVSILNEYRQRTAKALSSFYRVWQIVFIFCSITGVLGALILIEAFLRSLWKMLH